MSARALARFDVGWVFRIVRSLVDSVSFFADVGHRIRKSRLDLELRTLSARYDGVTAALDAIDRDPEQIEAYKVAARACDEVLESMHMIRKLAGELLTTARSDDERALCQDLMKAFDHTMALTYEVQEACLDEIDGLTAPRDEPTVSFADVFGPPA